jgi:predicted GNAT family acetyltransferase
LDGAVEITITDVAEKERFEARDAAGALAGFVTYQLTGAIIVYTHTSTMPEHQGQGVAGQLARFVMDDARERHRTVVPICPYIAEWLGRHPEYADVVAHTTKKVK